MSNEHADTTTADAERAQHAAETIERATTALVANHALDAAGELAWHTAQSVDVEELERTLVELACAGVAATARTITDNGAPVGCGCGRDDCPGWTLALDDDSSLDESLPVPVAAAMRGVTAALNNEHDAARDVFEAIRASEGTEVLASVVTATVRMAADAREQLGDGAP